MRRDNLKRLPVLIAGNGRLACGVALCLKEAGHRADLLCDDATASAQILEDICRGLDSQDARVPKEEVSIIEQIPAKADYQIAFLLTPEDEVVKKTMIQWIEGRIDRTAIIAVTTESIDLHRLQQGAQSPERICGINWTEPAYTTLFLEIIINTAVREDIPRNLISLATNAWHKDPYVTNDFGIRGRLISAMVREAFYLVENGYASVEDIDRACRNDAGYYLPFAGNCRYMDLMGTRAYGMVMKDLNPSLCNDTVVPEFFAMTVNAGNLGMEAGAGMYRYTPEEVKSWKENAERFSHEIKKIIDKYPFGSLEQDSR